MGYFRVHVTAFSSLSGSFTNTQPTEDFFISQNLENPGFMLESSVKIDGIILIFKKLYECHL